MDLEATDADEEMKREPDDWKENIDWLPSILLCLLKTNENDILFEGNDKDFVIDIVALLDPVVDALLERIDEEVGNDPECLEWALNDADCILLPGLE